MPLNVVLFEPEIPQNTGNIARTCAVVGANLHLVKPYGFRLSDKFLKRSGLDYWDKLNLFEWTSSKEFLEAHAHDPLYFFTGRTHHTYTDANYEEDAYLIFGRETAGINPDILEAHANKCVRIPMRENLRSLNLSNAVAIAVYEAARQNNFCGLL